MNPRATFPKPSLNKATLLLIILLGFTFLPWLGDTLFNTKGEPREAIVALSMLKTGNFILPESYGGDIPYKPPFLAWLIAGISLLTGSPVTEFSSRLPSALAAIAMLAGCFRYLSNRSGSQALAAGVALVAATTVEVFRAAEACRVDMILTACTVGAILAMASAADKAGRVRLSAGAILLMTCGVLTKGPVGALLPCGVVWVYGLLRGYRFSRTGMIMAAQFLLSLLLPALWYYAAWQQGGDRFMQLALEENVGRMSGTMSYGSHENPWWYNLLTVTAGMTPYTLLCLLALSAVQWRCPELKHRHLITRLRNLRPETLLSVVTTVLIFLFYCLPKSKRSVYLLPIYPFLAYFVVLLIRWLGETLRGRRVMAVYSAIIASAGLFISWLAWGLHMVNGGGLIAGLKGSMLDIAAGLFNTGFNAADWLLLIICIATCAATWISIRRRNSFGYTAAGSVLSALTVYWVVWGIILPQALNPKSDITLARHAEQLAAGRQIYSYNSAHLLRYYTTAFYLDDTVRLFVPDEYNATHSGYLTPDEGVLIISRPDMDEWTEIYGPAYSLDTLYTASRKSCDARAIPMIIAFRRADAHQAAETGKPQMP